MKRLRLPNLVCAAALVVVVGSAVGASDQPTQTPVQNRAEKMANRSGSERCYEAERQRESESKRR